MKRERKHRKDGRTTTKLNVSISASASGLSRMPNPICNLNGRPDWPRAKYDNSRASTMELRQIPSPRSCRSSKSSLGLLMKATQGMLQSTSDRVTEAEKCRYNMPCYIIDYAIDESALKEDRRVEDIPGDALVFQPLYV